MQLSRGIFTISRKNNSPLFMTVLLLAQFRSTAAKAGLILSIYLSLHVLLFVLHFVQLSENPVALQEFFPRSFFGNPLIIDNDNAIGIADRC